MAVSPSVIDLAACERLVGVAVKACPTAGVPAATPISPAPQPEWDALANSFASLGVALTWGGLLLGAIAIIAGLAWAKVVKRDAEEEARIAANECVKKMMDAWLVEQAPGIIRRHVENLGDASLGSTDDGAAADEMGREAG